MQRVLSFQMARGFGESSEFVTKRMCFSFLFSVGFLSLLCGFLLGRFAAERTIAFRAEKKQLELAGNGLDSTEHLQHLLLRELEGVSLDSDDFITKHDSTGFRDEDKRRVNEVMSNLSFIPRVTENVSSITATIRGCRESDRYVVISASHKGISIALEILKALSTIHRDYEWKPRRTLVFCLFSGNEDPCITLFPPLTQRKIVGYIALHGHVWSGRGDIKVTATEITLSIISQAIKSMLHSFTDRIGLLLSRSSDTTIDVPHVAFSLAGENRTYEANDGPKDTTLTIFAQIVSDTIWRLSESLIVKWDPSDFNRTGLSVLESFNNTQFYDVRDKVRDTMERLVTNVVMLNKRIDAIDPNMIMDLRIFGDIFMDLARALMCPNRTLQDRLHWESLQKLHQELPTKISLYFNETIMCYESAIRVLYDW